MTNVWFGINFFSSSCRRRDSLNPPTSKMWFISGCFPTKLEIWSTMPVIDVRNKLFIRIDENLILLSLKVTRCFRLAFLRNFLIVLAFFLALLERTGARLTLTLSLNASHTNLFLISKPRSMTKNSSMSRCINFRIVFSPNICSRAGIGPTRRHMDLRQCAVFVYFMDAEVCGPTFIIKQKLRFLKLTKFSLHFIMFQFININL